MLTRHAKLITPLCILLETRNLSDAADKLAVTRSAASKILKKAREIFNDPLLERRGNEMMLTVMGKELLPKLQRLRKAAADCFPEDEDVAVYNGRFTIQLPSGFLYAAGDRLIDAILQAIPGIQLCIDRVSDLFMEQLSSGEVDMVVYIHEDFAYPFEVKPLFKSRPGIFLARGHRLETVPYDVGEIQKQPVILSGLPAKGARYEAALKMLRPTTFERRVILQSSDIPLIFKQAMKREALVLASPLLITDDWIRKHFRLIDMQGPAITLFEMMSTSIVTHNRNIRSELHRRVGHIIGEVLSNLNDQAIAKESE